jgi:hypothetical protein
MPKIYRAVLASLERIFAGWLDRGGRSVSVSELNCEPSLSRPAHAGGPIERVADPWHQAALVPSAILWLGESAPRQRSRLVAFVGGSGR